MNVSFIEPAYLELRDAIDYYNQELPGLGNKFYQELLTTINLINKFPQAWSSNSKHTRKAILKVFPFNTFKNLKVVVRLIWFLA
jgi:hypothetical protein